MLDDPDGAPEGSRPPEVAHTEAGDAVAGVDYTALPETFTASDMVQIHPLWLAEGAPRTVTLTITLQPGPGYVVGEPSTFTLTIVHLERRCDAPTFADIPTNVAQTIEVGARPVPLQLVDPVNGTAFAALIDGRLPPGVELARDGTFTGAARVAGTYVATIGSCRQAFTLPPGFCTRATFTVTVLGTALARTG